MKTIDVRGLACPKPVVATKSALHEIASGEQLTILTDNEASYENVKRYLVQNGFQPECVKEDNLYKITVQKAGEPLTRPETEPCRAPEARPHIIVFSSDKMGRGSEELGGVLAHALINIIEEVKPWPSHLVFYNGGIFLACEGSPLIDTLKSLEKKGIAILVCGTCVNHFGKQKDVRVGTISNMYTILEIMTAAGHVVQP